MAGFLSVKNLCKRFGDHWAVDDVSFDVEEGKLLVLLGPSGCGKTTTLRCIGGLEQPDKGEISIDAQTVTNVNTDLFVSPENRGMGMVAQSYAIWPHMTVFENVAFPLRMRKERGEDIPDRVGEALRMVQLEDFGDRNATDLSGGQQQRVALARAIVGRPKVLLFDEPLSNLDANLREQMRYLLKDIQREIGITAVYVTHDQDEAMGLGDQLVVMNEGKIEQTDNARALYSEPVTQFVAEFIGVANLLKGSLRELSKDDDTMGLVKLEGSSEGATLQCRAGRAPPGHRLNIDSELMMLLDMGFVFDAAESGSRPPFGKSFRVEDYAGFVLRLGFLSCAARLSAPVWKVISSGRLCWVCVSSWIPQLRCAPLGHFEWNIMFGLRFVLDSPAALLASRPPL